MSWGILRVHMPVLEGLLHLSEHDIQIIHAKTVPEHGDLFLDLHLIGEDLPNSHVRAVMQMHDDGRVVLLRLEPTRAPRRG